MAPRQPEEKVNGRPRPAGGVRKGPPKGRKQDDALSFANKLLTAPPNLATHTNLHKLDLSNCGLTRLDFVKDAASHLTWLNVSGNDLSAPDAWHGVELLSGLFVLNASSCSLTAVPSVVASLTTLKALVLTHNALTSLAHLSASHIHLNTLVASHNSLTSLPAALSYLKALTKLSAAHNALTSASLPDLSTLPKLREVRLNDNPLDALPEHFGTWGKVGAGARGLEIVELGNCGFADWVALRYLAGQSTIVNLGLRGNPVVDEALEDGGFESFKAKMTILLPALRILDAQRFDQKYADLKAKRDARPVEQKILDAGPMALEANLKSENPVRLAALEKSRGKKRRREKPVEDAGANDVHVDRVEPVVTEVTAPTEDSPVPRKRKREKRLEDGDEVNPPLLSTEATAAEIKEAKKQKRKNRHAARREAETGNAARPTAALSTPIPSTSALADKPQKKRGRESKVLGATRVDEERTEPTAKKGVDDLPARREKKRKVVGGLLDELRGDGTEETKASPKVVETETERKQEKSEEKFKTSVLKVVEVKKKPRGGGVDVLELLSTTPSAVVGNLGGWD